MITIITLTLPVRSRDRNLIKVKNQYEGKGEGGYKWMKEKLEQTGMAGTGTGMHVPVYNDRPTE